MLRRFCLVGIFVAISTTLASAQVTFERKFVEGSKTTVQKDQKTTQTLTLNGMNIDTKSTVFVVATSTVGKREPDGTLKMEEKVESMQSEITLPIGTLQFDSANADKKPDSPLLEPFAELLRTISKMPLTVHINSQNKIIDIKLPEGEYEKLPPLAGERLNPETLKKAMEQGNAFLPEEPVKPGDTWERSTETNLGGGQTLSVRTKYEYKGTVENDGKMVDKIVGKSIDVNYAMNGNATMQVKSNDLKVVGSDNSFLFDRERGMIVSSATKIQIAGPLTLVINGTELVGKVDLTIEEATTRVKS